MKSVLLIILLVFALFALPDDAPIQPFEMQSKLGRGFDVSWVEFGKNIEFYSDLQVQAMKEQGFSTARIRTKLPADSTLFSMLDVVIEDCFEHGVIPIIAYNALEYELNPTAETLESDRLWWETVANHYQNYPHTLLFNLNIEWSEIGGKNATGVNHWYETVTPGIRSTNPTRIIIYSPIKLSNPSYLPDMKIPESGGEYVMAEFHSYAAGPSSDSLSANGRPNPKYWTTGTEYQKELVRNMIATGRNWQDSTGIATWLGAWMAGNVNHGNTFPASDQAIFAEYFVHVLDSLEIPWAINTLDMYYDIENDLWIDSMNIVRDLLSPQDNTSVSPVHSTRRSVSLEVSRKGTDLAISTFNSASHITLYSVSGRKLYSKKSEGNTTITIDISSLSPGIYFIQATHIAQVSQKILIE